MILNSVRDNGAVTDGEAPFVVTFGLTPWLRTSVNGITPFGGCCGCCGCCRGGTVWEKQLNVNSSNTVVI
ncbi:MAG TPA: hypothetical protein VIJ75_16445 [Hanamia sp.]